MSPDRQAASTDSTASRAARSLTRSAASVPVTTSTTRCPGEIASSNGVGGVVSEVVRPGPRRSPWCPRRGRPDRRRTAARSTVRPRRCVRSSDCRCPLPERLVGESSRSGLRVHLDQPGRAADISGVEDLYRGDGRRGGMAGLRGRTTGRRERHGRRLVITRCHERLPTSCPPGRRDPSPRPGRHRPRTGRDSPRPVPADIAAETSPGTHPEGQRGDQHHAPPAGSGRRSRASRRRVTRETVTDSNLRRPHDLPADDSASAVRIVRTAGRPPGQRRPKIAGRCSDHGRTASSWADSDDQRGLVARAPDELHADRQSAVRPVQRDRDRRLARSGSSTGSTG